MRPSVKDSDGVDVFEGDYIEFSYGIPVRSVLAPIVMREGKLIAITAGHRPPEYPLARFHKSRVDFWKSSPPADERE